MLQIENQRLEHPSPKGRGCSWREICDFYPRTEKVYNSIRFSTLSLPCLNDYYELFYKDGRKIIPNNISELLTARGLAYFIMDDSGKSYYGQTIIHTRFYTKLEVELLQETLFKNFGLTSRLEEKSKDQWILYIQVRQDVKNKLSPGRSAPDPQVWVASPGG